VSRERVNWTDRGVPKDFAMTEAEWLACTDPQKMLELARNKATVTESSAVTCSRPTWARTASRFVPTVPLQKPLSPLGKDWYDAIKVQRLTVKVRAAVP
jgi:hypothetical protein